MGWRRVIWRWRGASLCRRRSNSWSSATRKMMAVGQDTLDWKKIFSAAKTGGLKNYFVEMDWDLMQGSVPYLRKLQV